MLNGQWSTRVCRLHGQAFRPFLGRLQSVLIGQARKGHSLAIGRTHPIGRDDAAQSIFRVGDCPMARRSRTGKLRCLESFLSYTYHSHKKSPIIDILNIIFQPILLFLIFHKALLSIFLSSNKLQPPNKFYHNKQISKLQLL